jgi:hypothetical protein
MKLSDDRILTKHVEHPELVARRIERFADG